MPEAVTMKIKPETREAIRDMADRCGTTMQDFLDKLVADQLSRQFFDEMNSAWSEIRNDKSAWAEESSERALWDHTLQDALD